MRSGTSSSERVRQWFYPAILKKNIARFWPLWLGWGLVWFLLVVPRIFSYADNRWHSPSSDAYPRTLILDIIISYGPWMAALFGILAAMVLFSYLCNHRSAGFFHALPVRREGLFFTNYLSGLLFLFVPLAAVAGLAGLAELWVTSGFDFPSLFLLVFCVGAMGFFFYSFAVFCAMFTGHILALPAFYGILNGLIWAIFALFYELCHQFLYGYTADGLMDEIVLWFTPLLNLYSKLGYDDEYHLTGLFPIFVYAFVGLILTALALVAYRRRRIESAGDVISISWVRPIFKYGVALCAGVVLGTGTWALFFDGSHQNPTLLALCVLLWGGAGYFVSEMLLRKSFRVFRAGWKGAVLSMAVLGLLCGALIFDLTGYESRVPQADAVTSVELRIFSYPNDFASASSVSLTEPEHIAAAVALHQSIVDQREILRKSDGNEYSISTTSTGVPYATEDIFYTEFTYHLTNGGTLSRHYSLLPVSDALLADPSSLCAQLTALVNQPEVLVRYYAALDAGTLSGAYLETQSEWSDSEQQYVSLEEAGRLLEAVQSDLEAGRIGRRFLLHSLERLETCYSTDLVFFLRTDPSEESRTVSVTLQTTARDTLAVLEELGLASQLRLLSDPSFPASE